MIVYNVSYTLYNIPTNNIIAVGDLSVDVKEEVRIQTASYLNNLTRSQE